MTGDQLLSRRKHIDAPKEMAASFDMASPIPGTDDLTLSLTLGCQEWEPAVVARHATTLRWLSFPILSDGLRSMIENEFRKHADRCLTEAQRATKKAERAFWLLLAENWQKLAKESEVREKDEATDLLSAPRQ